MEQHKRGVCILMLILFFGESVNQDSGLILSKCLESFASSLNGISFFCLFAQRIQGCEKLHMATKRRINLTLSKHPVTKFSFKGGVLGAHLFGRKLNNIET